MNDNATPPTKPIPKGQNLTPGSYYRITEIDLSQSTLQVGGIVLCADASPGCIAPISLDGCWFADYRGPGEGYETLVTGVELVEAPS